MAFAAGVQSISEMEVVPTNARPIGYAALVAGLDLNVPLPRERHLTFETPSTSSLRGNWTIIRRRDAPEDTLFGNLEYALKHEGPNLLILKRAFQNIDRDTMKRFVMEKPQGVYSRQAWFLYEWLTGRELDIPDLKRGNYAPLLDDRQYFTRSNPDDIRAGRYRIVNNALGNADFCPVIRKTKQISANLAHMHLAKIQDITGRTPNHLMKRAASALVLSESRTTYKLENEEPPESKIQRWGKAILQAGQRDLNIEEILRLQKMVLRDRDDINFGVRKKQGFVGTFNRQHEADPKYLPPAPSQAGGILEGMLGASRDLATANEDGSFDVDPVVQAAMLSFGFVYLHPLEDGNGRVHRYLIHDIMARTHVAPENMIFPISVPILEHEDSYAEVLLQFDEYVMPYTEWTHAGNGGVQLLNDIGDFFRFPDLTNETEFVGHCLAKTVDTTYPREIDWIRTKDEAMRALHSLVELPDKRMNDFVKFALQNPNGLKLPKGRQKLFADLDPGEIEDMEETIQNRFGAYFERWSEDNPHAPGCTP